MEIRTEQVIDVQDWDKLVQDTYKRIYSFQQQDDCKERGRASLTVPADPDDFERDSVPEKVNHPTMGVSFKAWLERDPQKKIPNDENFTGLWWERNFYPHVSMIANDLHKRGLIEAGEYSINIDW